MCMGQYVNGAVCAWDSTCIRQYVHGAVCVCIARLHVHRSMQSLCTSFIIMVRQADIQGLIISNTHIHTRRVLGII